MVDVIPPAQGTNGAPAGGTNQGGQDNTQNNQTNPGQNGGDSGQQSSGADRLQSLYKTAPQLETYLKHLESEARSPLLKQVNLLKQQITELQQKGTSQGSQSDGDKGGKEKPLTMADLEAFFTKQKEAEKQSQAELAGEQEKGAFVQKFPDAIPHLDKLPVLRTTFGLSYEAAREFYKKSFLGQQTTTTPPGSQAGNTNTSTANGNGTTGANGQKQVSRDEAMKAFESKYL